MTGIYQIRNKLNDRSYIGQALNIELRFEQHKEALSTSNKSWYPQARLESNNINDFEFNILQTCCPEELDELEEYWIKKLNTYYSGYNRTRDGQGKTSTSKIIYLKKTKELSKQDIFKVMKSLNGNAFKLWLYLYLKCGNESDIIIINFSPSIINSDIGLGRNGPTCALEDLVKLNYCTQKDNNYYIKF